MGKIYNKSYKSSLHIEIGSVDMNGTIYTKGDNQIFSTRVGYIKANGTIYRYDDPSSALTTETYVGYIDKNGLIYTGYETDFYKSEIGYISNKEVYKGAKGSAFCSCVGYFDNNTFYDWCAAAFLLLLSPQSANNCNTNTGESQTATADNGYSDSVSNNKKLDDTTLALLICLIIPFLGAMTFGPVFGIIGLIIMLCVYFFGVKRKN